MRASLVTLAAAALAACISPADPPQAGETSPPEPFELRVGEERQAGDGLTVRFAAVIGDSRCPRDVTCIWEGDAEIEATVTHGDDSQALRLHTHGGDGYPRQAVAFGYTLELKALEPYPVSTRETAPEDYVATLVLTAGE